MGSQLYEKNHTYWIKRAPGYSEVNHEELDGEQNKNWSDFLEEKISNRFVGVPRNEVKILDVGAGPGFISIILTKLGYSVTAFDFAETMIEQAKINARKVADKIQFVQGDAQNLPFTDASYDVVISRNLTWNLEKPKLAYQEWHRVLKKNGMLLNFDANWYGYLFDDEKKEAYENDRQKVADNEITDYNIGDNFDAMESIAEQLPLSNVIRPKWDEEYLSTLGMKNLNADVHAWKRVWSKEEKINFSSTPLFLVSGEKC